MPYAGLGTWIDANSNPNAWVLPGATLDLNFKAGLYFGTSLASLVTSRASNALAVDAQGNWHTFGSNVPAITNLGLWVWEARTNLFLNSQAPATQSIAVVSGSVYTVSLYGVGSLVLSGAGTGTVMQGSPVSFVAGSTSLTVTTAGVTGAFVNVQVELVPAATTAAQGFPTPPIVTAASAVARAADSISLAIKSTSGPYAPYAIGTTFSGTPVLLCVIIELDDGTGANRVTLRRNSGAAPGPIFLIIVANSALVNAGIGGASNWLSGVQNKISAFCSPSGQRASYDGVLDTNSYAVSLPTVNTLRIGSAAGASQVWNGVIPRIALAPVSLNNQ